MWPLLYYARALNVDFYNSSEFADPQVTTSVNIILWSFLNEGFFTFFQSLSFLQEDFPPNHNEYQQLKLHNTCIITVPEKKV